MPFPQTSFAERQHNTQAAERASADRAAALACNDILTEAEANTLLLALDLFPKEALAFIQDVFENRAYPDESLDTSYLDRNGRATWAAFKAYRGA